MLWKEVSLAEWEHARALLRARPERTDEGAAFDDAGPIRFTRACALTSDASNGRRAMTSWQRRRGSSLRALSKMSAAPAAYGLLQGFTPPRLVAVRSLGAFMSRVVLVVFVAVSAFSRTAFAQETTDPERLTAPRQAVLVRVGNAWFAPSGGLSYERLVSPHLALVVGADAFFASDNTSSHAGGSAEVGARWYFFDRPLSGPWLGVSLTGGVSEQVRLWSTGLVGRGDGGLSCIISAGGLPACPPPDELAARQLEAGGRLLVGWTFRFDNRITLQLAAGPSGSVTRTRFLITSAVGTTSEPHEPTMSTSVRLTAFAAVGVAL